MDHERITDPTEDSQAEIESSDGTPSPSRAADPDDPFKGGQPIEEALEKLRLRLLDLTARNRLLNFKHTSAKTLQFVEGDPAAVYTKLIESAEHRIALVPLPEPKPDEWVTRQGRVARPDVREYAKALGISASSRVSQR